MALCLPCSSYRLFSSPSPNGPSSNGRRLTLLCSLAVSWELAFTSTALSGPCATAERSSVRWLPSLWGISASLTHLLARFGPGKTVLKLNLSWAIWVCSMELHKALGIQAKGYLLCSLSSRPHLHEILAWFTPLFCWGVHPQHHLRLRLCVWGWRLCGILSGYNKTHTQATVPQDWPRPLISCHVLFIRGTHLKRPWWEGHRRPWLMPGCEL